MARVDVVMPKMGESVMEGTVLEWKKAVGETVEQDETLLEISTDKVDSEVPSPTGGRIVEILVQENDTVDVGTPIAVIETDVNAPMGGGDGAPDAGADAPEAEAPEAVEEAAEPLDVNEPTALAEEEPAAKPAAPIMRTQEAAEAEAQDAASGDGAPDTSSAPAGGGIEVVMPKMGESVMEGTILEWKKAVGETVEQDETLFEISTDKVDSEVPSPAAGTLVQILVEEGETVEVGTPIALIGSAVEGTVEAPSAPPTAEGEAETVGVAPAGGAPEAQPAGASGDGHVEDAPEPAEKSYGFSGQPGGPGLAEPAEESASGDGIPRRDDEGNFYSPLVRSIAEAEGVSLAELKSIQGSGTEGRVTKADVMGYLDSRAASGADSDAAPAAPAEQSQAQSPAEQTAPPLRRLWPRPRRRPWRQRPPRAQHRPARQRPLATASRSCRWTGCGSSSPTT